MIRRIGDWFDQIGLLLGLILLIAIIFMAITSPPPPADRGDPPPTTCALTDWVCNDPHQAKLEQLIADTP